MALCCSCFKFTGTVSGTTFPATLTLTGPINKTFLTDSSGNYSKSFKLKAGDYILSVGGVDYAFVKTKCNKCLEHDFVVGGVSGIFVSQFVNQFV